MGLHWSVLSICGVTLECAVNMWGYTGVCCQYVGLHWSGIGQGRLQRRAVVDVLAVCGVTWSGIGQGRLQRRAVVDVLAICGLHWSGIG